MNKLTSTLQSARTLGIWEPWASAIAQGHKRAETRSWRTHRRGWHLLIATKTRNAITRQAELDLAHLEVVTHRGHAVALAYLGTCLPVEVLNPTFVGEKERSLGDFSEGRFAWIFPKVIPLTPFPAKAQQGFGFLSEEVIAELVKQVEVDNTREQSEYFGLRLRAS